MKTARRSITALFGIGALAVVQYHFPQPWRYILGAIELGLLTVAVFILWDRTRALTEAVQEQRARLDAIAGLVAKSQVLNRANRIIDAIVTAQVERGDEEAIDLPA